jgi:hypothetical protein
VCIGLAPRFGRRNASASAQIASSSGQKTPFGRLVIRATIQHSQDKINQPHIPKIGKLARPDFQSLEIAMPV